MKTPRVPFYIAVLCWIAAVISAPATPLEGEPRLKNYDWMSLGKWYHLHADDCEIALKGEAQLLFLGDSITQGWAGKGKGIWESEFERYGAANFGIGGDVTANLVWRLDHGAVGNLKPKAIILLIGTNDLGLEGLPPEIAISGIRTIVSKIRTNFPESKLLLFAVFPRGEAPDGKYRDDIDRINEDIQSLHDGKWIFYKDINDQLVESDGSISKEIMHDFLHLTEEGYQRWAKAINAFLEAEVELSEIPATRDGE